MNDRTGPGSLAATALADSPLSQAQQGAQAQGVPITNPNAPIAGTPITGVGPAQSGVSPTAASPGEAAAGAAPIGRVIHGRYRIKRLLGEGGMGGVYEGEHLEIGKRVAIKLVHALHARDPHIAARIKQEARSTGAIESEHIVQVFDAGEDETLGLFLVMEMLKGEDLSTLLLRKTRVSPMAAATMVMQAAQGLARAHAAGIVHRDLKPANIFLCTRDDGSSLVKLVDFGIAKLVRDANQQAAQGPTAGLTRMGMVIGTPQYMSPEQAQGLLTVDHRTDVYSLGAVLFETIVGASPYPEMPTYEQTILQIMTRPAPRISSVVHDVHPDLDQLCAEMMAHDMNARPANMTIVRDRLLRIFPEIEGGRLPMRSLTNEYDATVSADASGQIRAQVDAVLARSGLSGVGAAVQRPVTPPVSTRAVSRHYEDEPIDDVGGVPKKGKGTIVAVMVGFVVLGIGGGVAFMKMHAAPPAETNAGYGLVQAAAPATPAVTAAPVAQAAAIPTAPAAIDAKPAVAEKPAATPASAAATKTPSHPKPAKNAAPPAAAAPETKSENAPSRPVGGTGVSTEF